MYVVSVSTVVVTDVNIVLEYNIDTILEKLTCFMWWDLCCNCQQWKLEEDFMLISFPA